MEDVTSSAPISLEALSVAAAMDTHWMKMDISAMVCYQEGSVAIEINNVIICKSQVKTKYSCGSK